MSTWINDPNITPTWQDVASASHSDMTEVSASQRGCTAFPPDWDVQSPVETQPQSLDSDPDVRPESQKYLPRLPEARHFLRAIPHPGESWQPSCFEEKWCFLNRHTKDMQTITDSADIGILCDEDKYYDEKNILEPLPMAHVDDFYENLASRSFAANMLLSDKSLAEYFQDQLMPQDVYRLRDPELYDEFTRLFAEGSRRLASHHIEPGPRRIARIGAEAERFSANSETAFKEAVDWMRQASHYFTAYPDPDETLSAHQKTMKQAGQRFWDQYYRFKAAYSHSKRKGSRVSEGELTSDPHQYK